MGCHSAPYACQRVTSFICHIMQNLQYFLLNYVDNFMGLEHESRIWSSYNALGYLLHDIGAEEALDKAVPPAEALELLGVWFDFVHMTIGVTHECKKDILRELTRWKDKRVCTRTEMESLIGKLQFISRCVRAWSCDGTQNEEPAG